MFHFYLQAETEVEEDENAAEEDQATTTTEVPKKNLVGSGVRPFRTNNDLIEALKRRRQQVTLGDDWLIDWFSQALCPTSVFKRSYHIILMPASSYKVLRLFELYDDH